ncbi:hypothetical protein LY90DRAFT_706010 [Neocallimastix californiae]|uniref:CBM1 domain-containing protein n=1 Tax=Neocallimastix californiae TaxID=1754190 RepID=A0A1Y2AW84_9FUNG|nr:hypothetical protein LY90DRAFT_706010 [Neocallimastix californiae]|eukprot:ORY26829.1 hypothetical protein LY90DRAFT_706010 [Neocallimastix californiae]
MHLYNITFFLFSVLTVFAQNAYKTLPNTRTSTTKISSTSSNKPISYESCKANCRSIHSSTSKSLDWCFEDCIKFLRNKPGKTLPGKTLPGKTISTTTTTTTTSTEVLATSTSSNEPTSYESCKASCRSIHSSTSKSLDWCFEDCIKFLRNKPVKTLPPLKTFTTSTSKPGKTLPPYTPYSEKTISTTTTTTSTEVLAISTSSNEPTSYESCKANCRSIHSSTSKSLDWCFEDCIKFLRNKPGKTLTGKTLPGKTISTTTTTTTTSIEVLATSTSSNEPTSYESCKANCRSIHSSTSKSLDWCFEDCIKFLRNKPGKTLPGKTLPGKTISTTTTTTTTSIEVLATSTSSNEPTSYESCKANCRSIHSSTSKSLDWCFEDCIKFLRNKTEKTLPVKTLPPLKTSTTSTTKPGKTLPPLTSSTTSTKSIPTSTKTTPISTKTIPISTKTIPISTKTIPISTKTIPISTKTIPTGDCVPSTVTVKEKITITEKVTVTVTNNGQQTPIVQENCAGKYGQCGGKGFNGPTCCQQGLSCKLVNEWYSQCL